MLKRLSLLLAAVGLLLPVTVSALGLGEIRLSSALNEPLRAEIPLISVSADEADLLSVRLASREQYEQAGIEQVPELRQLRFETVTGAGGKPVIRVTTRDAVAEPFLNFLIEVNWPSGRVVREYTVLLDPPTLMRGAPPVSQLPAVSEPAAARPPSVSAPPIVTATGGEYGPVATGETLWVIAERVRPDSSLTIPQVMLALQRANPEAFIRNNINLLRAGVVLRVPDRAEMAALAADEARAGAQAQAAEWEAYRGQAAERVTAAPRTEAAAPGVASAPVEKPARLELVVAEKQPEAAPSAVPEGAGAPAGSNEVGELRRQLDLATEEAEARRLQNEDLSSQIRELEEQVAALEKLIEFNVDEMAALQQNLQAQEAVAETRQTPAESQAPTEEPPLTAAPAEGAPAVPVPAEGATAVAPAPAEAAGHEPASGEMMAAAPAEKEKVDAAEHGHAPGSEAAQGHHEEAKPAEPPPPPAPEPGLFEDPWLLGGAAAILLALVGVIVSRRRAAARGEDADETAPEQVEAAFDAAPAAAVVGARAAIDRAPKPSIGVDDDEAPAEPSFEAGRATGRDVLNQFAPEGVGDQEHGPEDPIERADVFLAYGRNEQAEEVLRNLLATEPGRVDAMLKLLEIYAAGRDRASFEHQLEDLHETLAGEGGPHWDRAIELARGITPDHRLLAGAAAAAVATRALADDEGLATGQADSDELDIDLDFEPVFGDEGEDGEPLDITQEFSGEELGDLADEGAVDAALSGETDTEGEEAPLDLGFDLEADDDDTEGGLEFSGGLDLEGLDTDEETLVATGLDLDGLDDEAESDGTQTDEAVEPADERVEEDSLDLDMGLGLDADTDTDTDAGEVRPGVQTTPDGREETPADDDLDLGELDLGDLDATLDEDDAFDFDAGADMVDTKLELASTYVEMEDYDGARSILEEVLEEGSDAQKAKARELQERLPG